MDNLRIFQIFKLFPFYLIPSSISLSPLTFYRKQADMQGPYLQHFGLKHPYLNINFMVHKLHLPEYPRTQFKQAVNHFVMRIPFLQFSINLFCISVRDFIRMVYKGYISTNIQFTAI